MRIPLDYYRILGVPLQATADQLQQAHRDRTMQLPRREYSETAIASRKSLLDQAYTVLSNPETKLYYDQNTFRGSSETNRPSPDHRDPDSGNLPLSSRHQESGTLPLLDIDDHQTLGGLLILLELGEYELVLSLGQNYLDQLPSVSPAEADYAIPPLSRADGVLTLALAGLELGREQWQQGTYEQAAISLETAEKLLLKEGVFPSLRGEIQADLYKLRPYRILELLSETDENAAAHRQGIQMLRDMLQERGGLDGTGDDQSGLNIDDFLRFMQQLRGYLTSLEQQTLFETEAQRPSAVATYLTVYALLVRGFAYKQPALINRAKRMLMRLGSRQDVHLEQAVCCLLLGQTEEASGALELSREYDPLTFIRENSQGAPDLLPGLCLYSERWLQEEVFPHFRDLRNCKQTLKEYFADDQVQAYLEALPLDRTKDSQDGGVGAIASQPQDRSRWEGNLNKTQTDMASSTGFAAPTAATTALLSRGATSEVLDRQGRGQEPRGRSRSDGAGVSPKLPGRDGSPRRSPSKGSRHWASRDRLPSVHWGRVGLLVGGALLGLGIVLWAIASLVGRVGSWFQERPALEGEQLQLILNQPVVEIPDPPSQPPSATGPLNQESAKKIIETWLAAKGQALGSGYQVEQLSSILAEPALSEQRRRSQQYQQERAYGEYQHQVTVNQVTMNGIDENSAIVEAIVAESVKFYSNGQVDESASYSDKITVQYQLIRQNGQWRIQDWST